MKINKRVWKIIIHRHQDGSCEYETMVTQSLFLFRSVSLSPTGLLFLHSNSISDAYEEYSACSTFHKCMVKFNNSSSRRGTILINLPECTCNHIHSAMFELVWAFTDANGSAHWTPRRQTYVKFEISLKRNSDWLWLPLHLWYENIPW